MSAPRRQPPAQARGFSLLEVMIALVISGLALASVFRSAMESTRATAAAAHYQEATSRARSHLDGVTAALVPGETEGDDGGGYHWHVSVRAVDFDRQDGRGRQGGRRRGITGHHAVCRHRMGNLARGSEQPFGSFG